jgi:hypothetical protein
MSGRVSARRQFVVATIGCVLGLSPEPRSAEPVTARATLRWPNHPRAVCAADKLADCGHVSIIARGGRGFIHSGAQHAMIGAS